MVRPRPRRDTVAALTGRVYLFISAGEILFNSEEE